MTEKSIQQVDVSQDTDVISFKEIMEYYKSEANLLKIESAEDEQGAANLISQITTNLKQIEKKRHFFVDGPTTYVNKINAHFKLLRNSFDDIKKSISTKMLVWRKKVQEEEERKLKEAEEAERKRQEEIMKQQEAEIKKAEEENREPEIIEDNKLDVIDIPDPVKKTVRSESGSVTYRTKKIFTITDFSKVPDDYKLINEVKVRKAQSLNIEIPGIEYSEIEDIVTRT